MWGNVGPSHGTMVIPPPIISVLENPNNIQKCLLQFHCSVGLDFCSTLQPKFGLCRGHHCWNGICDLDLPDNSNFVGIQQVLVVANATSKLGIPAVQAILSSHGARLEGIGLGPHGDVVAELQHLGLVVRPHHLSGPRA